MAPHPDDAEIAAFGLYAGRNATIVTVTSGNAGDANYATEFPDPAQQYLFKGFLRAVDSVTVPWQGGIPPDRAYNLGYFDARLRTMREKRAETVAEMYGPNRTLPSIAVTSGPLLPKGPRANAWPNLVGPRAILKKVDPQIVVAAHPYLDYHADPAAHGGAGRGSPVEEAGVFPLYTNHATATSIPVPPGRRCPAHLPADVGSGGSCSPGRVLPSGGRGAAEAEATPWSPCTTCGWPVEQACDPSRPGADTARGRGGCSARAPPRQVAASTTGTGSATSSAPSSRRIPGRGAGGTRQSPVRYVYPSRPSS